MKDDFLDNLKELVSGGYIMLFIFGGTLCFMATTSLIAIIMMDAKVGPNMTAEITIAMFNAKMALFKEIIVGLMGFLAGAYTTMWNNQHFKKENINVKENDAVSSDSDVVDSASKS